MDDDSIRKLRRRVERLLEFLDMAPVSPPQYICREVRLIAAQVSAEWPDEYAAAGEDLSP